MVNPDVDGYTKTPNQRKILRRTKKKITYYKLKIILKPKYMLSGCPFFTFSWPGEWNGTFALLPMTQLQYTLQILIKRK